MTMFEKLKPCPFCGSPGYAGEHKYKAGEYIVRCSNPGAGCPLFPSSGPLMKKELPNVIRAWNSRIPAKEGEP